MPSSLLVQLLQLFVGRVLEQLAHMAQDGIDSFGLGILVHAFVHIFGADASLGEINVS